MRKLVSLAIVLASALTFAFSASASSPLNVISERANFIPLGVFNGTALLTGVGSATSTLYSLTSESATPQPLYTFPGPVIAINQTRAGTLIAGVLDGAYSLYRSTNGGSSWSATTQEYVTTGIQLHGFRGPGGVGYYLLLGPQSMVQTDAGLFAVTYNTLGARTNPNYLYKSVDDGQTWHIIYKTVDFRHGHGMVAVGNTLYILWGDSAGGGIWKSTDNGIAWNAECTDYHCVTVSAVVNSAGALYFDSDNPAPVGSSALNGIYRVAGGRSALVLATTHVSYGSQKAPGGQLIIGETYEPSTSRVDPLLHLYVSADDGATFTDALTRAIPAAEGNWHLLSRGFFPSGDVLVQTPTGYLVASLSGVTQHPVPTPKSDADKLAFMTGFLTPDQLSLYQAWLAS